MKRLAIIPARGGSKRIPRKNIKSFLGKPIISYSIEAAFKSNIFTEVMVSTDDEEIADISKKYGAKIPFLRSHKNADDFATTSDVIKEVLHNYKKENQEFESVCIIYPTAPLVQIENIVKGCKLLEENNFLTVIPIVKFSFPIQRSLRLSSDSKVVFNQPEFINTRSQDLELRYHDSGQFYWLNPKKLEDFQSLWTDNTGAIVLDETEVQDIDTMEDWKIAELKMELLNG